MEARWINTVQGKPIPNDFTTTNSLGSPICVDKATGLAYIFVGNSILPFIAGPSDPMWFGAVADGITDDTAAIQAAFNSSVKSIDLGGSERVYKISGALVPNSNTVICGHGATIKQTTNVMSIIDVTGKTGVVIDGVVFQDTGAGYVTNDGTPNAAVFGDAGTGNIAVRNCTFTATTYAAIRFKGGSGYDISHNTIVGPGQGVIPIGSNLRAYGILLDAGCNEYRVIANDVSATLHGIRVEQCTNGVIEGNDIHDIAGQHGMYIGAAVQVLAITGNEVFNIPFQGIKVQAQNGFSDTTDITVVGNVVKTCGDSGITLSNGAGSTAQATKVRLAIISNNTVNGCSGSGIDVQNAVNSVVSDNVIANCGFSGVSHSSCSYTQIKNNRVDSTGLSGIRDGSASSNMTIDGNILHNVGTLATAGDRFGIFIQTLDHTTISRNRVTSDVGGMQYGAFLAGGDQTTSIFNDNTLLNADDYAFRGVNSTTAFKQFRGNIFEGTLGATFNNPALPSVASAAALVLPTGNDAVLVTGTTSITSIAPNGHTGHQVVLTFDNVLTVTRGSNLFASSNFVTSSNDTITLLCDGNNWLEMSRSVN